MNQTKRNERFRELLATVETHNPSRRGQADRVSVYAVAMGKHVGFAENDLRVLRLSAMIHDAPKLQISREALENSASWADTDYSTLTAARASFTLPFDDSDRAAIEMTVRNQDNPSGSDQSRILLVAVAFDAMTHQQPWRQPMSDVEAITAMQGMPTTFWVHAVNALQAVAPLIQPLEGL